MKPIISLEQVTPEWLTGRLAERGYLPAGEVAGIEQARVTSHNADSAVLAVSYAAGIDQHRAPSRLFVKVARPEAPWNEVEFTFYTVVAAAMQAERPDTAWPFPRCYDAGYGGEGRGGYLLLEDLSASHHPAGAPLPPTPDQAEQIIDGLAAIHTFWWEHERLGVDVGRRQTAESIDMMIDWAAGNFANWAEFMGDRLAPRRRRILERIFAGWPERRKARVISGQGITVVHRDTHPLNFLYPNDKSDGSAFGIARIVDWQSWRVDTGTDDLAYMMACHWYPEYRARLERPLLARYHRRLLEHGVTGYEWDDCLYDYRASVIRCLFFLLGSWHPARPASMWWERLEKGLLAFEELGCGELLPG